MRWTPEREHIVCETSLSQHKPCPGPWEGEISSPGHCLGDEQGRGLREPGGQASSAVRHGALVAPMSLSEGHCELRYSGALQSWGILEAGSHG